MSDIDSLLDSTLDDLADLPSFKPFPGGAHRVAVTLDYKEINKKPTVEMKLKMIEAIEISEPTDEAPKAGDECNTLYFLDNDIGQGKFKDVAKIFGESLGISSIRDIIDQTKDIECLVITSVTKDRNDADKVYLNVKQVQVV